MFFEMSLNEMFHSPGRNRKAEGDGWAHSACNGSHPPGVIMTVDTMLED